MFILKREVALKFQYPKIIEKVKLNVNLPLIVGGGIKTKQQIEEAHNSGADIVVIGNALEDSPELIKTLV